MPELPEVESVLQCLVTSQPSLIGRLVQDVLILRESVVDGNPYALEQTLTGTICSTVFRHGKYLFFGFQRSRATHCIWMALHLRMTGRLFLVPKQEAWERHTRFVLLLDQELALRFDDPRAFGRVWLVHDPAEVTSTLGPDALVVTRDCFLARLAGLKRQLKPLLLDQSFVAGIGNIYTDEILFRARLHPMRTTDGLSPAEVELLYETMHHVLTLAVTTKGANIDGVFEAGSFPVQVYGRGGKQCSICATEIIKERLGQRGTHFCPTCQPRV
jgi:formamidopyrimidine-DNA glycosylase